MVAFVAVVVSKHPAIVHTTNPVIDVSQTVPHNFAVLSLPDFLFQLRTLAWPSQHVFCMERLRDRRLLGRFLSHHSSIAQMGAQMSHLYAIGSLSLNKANNIFPPPASLRASPASLFSSASRVSLKFAEGLLRRR